MDASKLVKIVIVLISLDVLSSIICLPLGNFGYNYSYPSTRSLNVYGYKESEIHPKPKAERETLPPASQIHISLRLTSNGFVASKQADVHPSPPSSEKASLKNYLNHHSQPTNTGYDHQIIYFDDNDKNSVIDYETTTDSSELSTMDGDLDNRIAAPVLATLLGR